MGTIGFDCGTILLIAFTYFLVVTDRAFSRKVRIGFQIALFASLLLVAFDGQNVHDFVASNSILLAVVEGALQFMRPLVLCVLLSINISFAKKRYCIVLVPMVFALALVVAGLGKYCFIIAVIYGIGWMVLYNNSKNRREISDIIFTMFFIFSFLYAFWAEQMLGNTIIVDDFISIMVCVYYFQLVMKTFKKDRLTGLLARHNLSFEMEDNYDKSYDLVLIDVDNFKLINDKYGHDKGDEVLVKIVQTALKYIPKGSRMFRFGGDEFIIISRKVDTEVLKDALEKANAELAEDDYRMSYGIVTHKPGDDSTATIVEADMAMYENKRLIKSEAIWDDMTGLYNLKGFLDELETFRKYVKKENRSICLVAVDVERLSNINKAFGYAEGNLVITVLAKALRSCLRGRDFIGHLGSDEFMVAIECANEEDEYVISFVEQLQDVIDNSFELSSKEYLVKINIDRSYIDCDSDDSSEKLVNDLLYIKQEDKDNRRKNDLTEAESELDPEEEALVLDIIDNNKLNYAFQPIVSAKDGSIVGYESLMRSNTETMVSPLTILKYAKHSKRLYDVEKLTMFNSLAKFAECKDIPENAKIFVNSIPGHRLSDVDFKLLGSKYSDIIGNMVVEITEGGEIDDDSLVLLNTRREKYGFDVAIDDYGSGVSNTNNLLRYMPQVVKLDRLLIAGIDRNAKKQFFVNSIVSFAKENDMKTLAEGVETESELKTVIKLGIDMVQGYVTAKPTIEVISEIPDEIKKIIIKENLKSAERPRMVYSASEAGELSVVQLAMEDYTQINISSSNLKISGSNEFTASMILKIKENIDCHLTLSDVKLSPLDGRPCIELGENTNLTLNIEGACKINDRGIFVPESSSLTIIGGGTLDIDVKGHECYAIGTDTQTPFGAIALKSSGLITLNIDGEECAGIGGGIAGSNSSIELLSGTVELNVAGVNAVGIGAHKGDVPIRVNDTDISSSFRVKSGTLMGTISGRQDIVLKDFSCVVNGSGTDITVIGSTENATGNIIIGSGTVSSKFTGHSVCFIGGVSGDVNIDISHASVNLHGEGDIITGFGTRDSEAKLSIKECAVELTINAATPLGIGAKEKEIMYIGPGKNFVINGDTSEIYDYL